MRMKKFTMLFLVLIMCLQMGFGMEVRADEQDLSAVNELYYLGILEEQSIDLSAVATRAEMAKYAVGLLGLTIAVPKSTETGFQDVAAEHPLSGYIKLALEYGIISKNESQTFRPDSAVLYEEALKMMITVLGYQDYVQKKGGYPMGYQVVANELSLLDGVSASIGSALNQKNAIRLVKNTLTIPLCLTETAYSAEGETQYSYTKKKDSESVLSKYFGISIYKVHILDVKNATNEITMSVLSVENNKEGSEFAVGDTEVLTLSEKIVGGDYKHALAEVWVNKDKKVLNITMDKNIKIINGYIDEVDKKHIQGAKHDPRYIENIALIGEEDYLDIAPDCTFYYNNQQIVSGGIPLIGSFARLVLYKDEILVLEAWDMAEGGIISVVDDNFIGYSQGERKGLKLNELDDYENLTIVINGEIAEKWALLPEFLFDYYADADKENLIIVASTRAITDIFTSVSSDSAFIGDQPYSLSDDYMVYYSVDGKEYYTVNSAEEILGKTVTAYLDYAGYIRYIKTAFFNEENAEFYGFVLGYNQGIFGKEEMKISRLYNDKVTEMAYGVYKNVNLGAGVSINAIVSDLQAINNESGDKNNIIKTKNLLFQFKVNQNNEIISIRNPNLFDACPATGISITAFSSLNYPYISSPRIYFDGAKICALYYDGTLKAKMLSWQDLMAKTCTNVRMDFYSEADSSEIELVILRGNVTSIGHGREEYVQYGLITKKTKIINPKTDTELVKVEIDGKKYKVSEASVSNITDYAYVVYGEDVPLSDEDDIMIKSAYNLSGNPDNWTVVENTTEGLHKGFVEKIDNRRIHFSDGLKFYMGSTISFYEIMDNGKIVQSEKSEVYEGAQIWYLYYFGEIRAAFFR